MNAILKRVSKLPYAPVLATLFGGAAGILTLATPQWLFARAVVASGLPDLLPAARPPLGQTAQMLAAVAAALLVGAVLYTIVAAIEKSLGKGRKDRSGKARGSQIAPVEAEEVFAGHRRPIFAETDLGAPLMSDQAMDVAKDELMLDMPLAEEVVLAPEVYTVQRAFEEAAPAEVYTVQEVAERAAPVEVYTVQEAVEETTHAPVYSMPAEAETAPPAEVYTVQEVAEAVDPLAIEPTPTAHQDASISGLMARLEDGLDKMPAAAPARFRPSEWRDRAAG